MPKYEFLFYVYDSKTLTCEADICKVNWDSVLSVSRVSIPNTSVIVTQTL